MTPTVQSGARWSGAAAGSRLGGGAAGRRGGGRRRQRGQIDDALGVARRAHTPAARDDLGDADGARREIDLPAADVERGQAEEVVTRARPPQGQIGEADECVRETQLRPLPLLIEFVARAEAQRPRADVERDQLVVIGREPLGLDPFQRQLAAGRERRQAQRPLLAKGAARDRPEPDRDLGGRAACVRQSLDADVDVANVGRERRLDRFVAEVNRRLLQRERVDGELGAGVGRRCLVAAGGRRGRRIGRPVPVCGGRRTRFGFGGTGRQVFQVDAPVAQPAHVGLEPREQHLLDVEPLRGQIRLADAHLQLLERGERLRPGLVAFLHVQLCERHVALDGRLRRVRPRSHERQVERQRQPRRVHREWQAHRYERHVAGEIERVQPQLEDGLERILERLGPPLDREGRPVDPDAEPGFDERIDVDRQRRDERHADGELADLVMATGRQIVEGDRQIADVDVVEREARRRRVGRCRRLR